MKGTRLLALVAAAILLSGCATAAYYLQAVHGHADLMRRAVPLDQAITSPQSPPALREKLARVVAIRDFASRELHLPDNGSYRSYSDLGRPFAVWNVFAAPELSVRPKESCFLFVGCVTYRGFYDENEARRHADELRRQGYDVFVGGVAAYSTLGWFDDPVLSSFVNYPEPEVARIIFHELAHQVVYARDDTSFNESFAVAVEQEGLRRWLEYAGSEEQRAVWSSLQSRRSRFVGLITRYRERFEHLYAETQSVEQKRAGKRALFDEMRREYEVLKAEWGGFAGYDRFFAEGPNNALLASISTYAELVPAFTALLQRHGGNMKAFYADVRHLAKLDKDARRPLLDELGSALRSAEALSGRCSEPGGPRLGSSSRLC
jgi:predicted aminopeptidase